ncbi:MAG: sigma-70 family RNA polymerase sigma factor [Planctomycetes bacterium]|nr:sigma-70 family RNA polymerase sigma factor [Planctomycetota bacterium]
MAGTDFPPLDPTESVHLAARARAGNSAALDDLLLRYQDRLRRIVRIRLGARLRANVESMDIVQEAMFVAARKIGDVELQSSAAIINWLSRIAEHKIHDANDYFTAQRRDRGREASMNLVINGESVGWEPADHALPPNKNAEQLEVEEIVDEALSELVEAQREVFLLRHYCGADWDEVARELERSVDAVQQLYVRARAALRKKVEPRLGG